MKSSIRRRRFARALSGAAIVASAFLPSGLAVAQSGPAECTKATLGQLSCQAGVRCECTYARPSVMRDTPAGFRWDCGIKRSRCDMPPATLDPWNGPYPSSIGIDRTTIYELPPDHGPRGWGRKERTR